MNDAQAMIASILGLAKEEAEHILATARDKAETLLDQARRELQRHVDAAGAQAEQKATIAERRVATGVELLSRKELLQAKVALLDEVFASAYAALTHLPEGGPMERLLLESAVSGDEEVVVSAGQEPRFAGLVSAVNERLKAAGKRGELRLSGEQDAVEAGFVLRGRDYTVDCSLRTLIAERRLTLEPEVARVLFSE